MIPDPELSSDWKDWARKVRVELERKDQARSDYVKATRLGVNNLPKAAEEGVLLYVPNAPDAATIYYSDGSQYLPLASRAWAGIETDRQDFSDTGITSTSWVNVSGATGFDLPGTPDGSRKYLAWLHAVIDATSGTANGRGHFGIFVGANGTVADTLVAATIVECFVATNTREPAQIIGREFTPGASETKWGIGAKVDAAGVQFDILQTADFESYAWIMEDFNA